MAKVLIVDDDRLILKMYSRLPYDVDTALGPVEALEKVRSGFYEVVVTDYMMPGMNGMDLLREVKRISPETIRVILTGHAELDVALEAVNESLVYRFLQKPCKDIGIVIEESLKEYERSTEEKFRIKESIFRNISYMTEMLEMGVRA